MNSIFANIFVLIFSISAGAADKLTCILEERVGENGSDAGVYRELARDSQIIDVNQPQIVLKGGNETSASFEVTLFPKSVPVKTDSGKIADAKYGDVSIKDNAKSRQSFIYIYGLDPSNPAFKIAASLVAGSLGSDGVLLLNCTK